ncbi:ATP-binding protein [Microcoleus sp. herbarium14]|uniref:ATP-binding response regulator n=1 Tax=Microcoleus sp. herbarium14 TaxID=3055439 RepID=UPI002FD0F23D
MPLTSPSLKHFIELVPLCQSTAALESLRSIFRSCNCDRVAVVNEQLQPLGLVYLRSLWALVADRTNDWEQPLSENPIAIEPIRTVSAALSVSEFWQYIQTEELNTPRASKTIGGLSKSPIGLTDASGQFLGLLDSMSLLQFAALNSSLSAKPTAVKEIELIPVSAAIATALGAQVRFLEAGLKPSENLNSLVQLLEKLPLPLRLQTPTGQIVSQNAAWRILLGAGPEPIPEPAANLGKHGSPQKPSHSTTEYTSAQVEAIAQECRSLVGASRSGDGLRDSFAARDSTAATSCSLPLYAAASPSTLTAPAWCPTAGKPDTYICDCPVQKGQERIWQFVKQPLWDQLILVMGQDVTEEHLVAKELAAKNADLIHLNRLKDEFLSCISHELKTPLTAVLGLSSLLKDKLIGELNDRQTRYAKLIHKSGRHLMTIVNDILDLTRMETGQLELIPEPIEIAATCKKAFEQAKQLQQQEEKSPPQPSTHNGEANAEQSAQIEFTLEIEPGLSYLIADELRLRQMLVNLLANALKFTPAGGKIGLKVNVWEGWLAFTVWDTGIGIPADKQHLIFQKFQQLESPLTRRFQGTGLGLVLTQRLARLHGGDVSFISSENQGSQFTLLLPPNPPGNSTEESPEPTAAESEFLKPKYQTLDIANSRSRLVLIVEAVPKYIEDLTNVLSGLGYQVIIARSGTEALEKARRFSPEAIFLNPLLPLLSGWDVLTLLKSDPDTRSIPAIVTATRGEKERASVNRAEGFLSLPVEEPALRRLLDSIARPDANTSKVRSSLTVLWLSPQNSSSQGSALLLNPTYCRVLEADDLGQAELVARIWRPDAIVLDSTSQLQNPSAFIEQLSRSRNLGSLPLVTLDPATTQLANQVKGLSVFPCLAAGSSDGTGLVASALWQVIQVAAGMSWKPSILFADISTLPDLHSSAGGNSMGELENRDRSTAAKIPVPSSKFYTPNFQALIQYIQTAGFRGSIAPCWTEVLQQLQYQSVDLVLLCLRDAPSESPAMLQALSNLRQMTVKPPILVWDYRSAVNSESRQAIDFLLQEVSAKILPSSLSAAQLLDKIQQSLLTHSSC